MAIDPKYISKLVFGSYLLVPGLTYKKLNHLEESLDCFMKLHAILRNSAEVMYQLANLYPTDTKCFHVFENVYVCASRGLTDLNLSKFASLSFPMWSSVGPWLIGFIYELLGDPQQAIEWLMQVISVTPTDPHALAKLGELYDSEGDKSQAFQHYYEVKEA